MKISIFKLLIMVGLLGLLGCVGTIEESNVEQTNTQDELVVPLSFSGILDAVAISDSKVVVTFLQAPGNQDDLIYSIYVNESKNPLQISGSSLQRNLMGQYTYTVSNLSFNTLYTFSVGVSDKSGNSSQNNKKKSTKTFANKTCDFDGISQLILPSGIDGKTNIIVKWLPVPFVSEFFPISTDPVSYVISYIDSSQGEIQDLFDPSNPHVYTIEYPEAPSESSPVAIRDSVATISTGVSPNKTYYINVRCKHKGFVDHKTDPGYKMDENNKVLSIKTLSSNSSLDFNEESFVIENINDIKGKSSALLKWSAATGEYSQYLLFYSKYSNSSDSLTTANGRTEVFNRTVIDELLAKHQDSMAIFPTTSVNHPLNPATNIYRKIISANKISDIVSGMEEYTYQEFILMVCKDTACVEREEAPIRRIRLQPSIAPFGGIVSIGNPTSIDEYQKITLNFDAPVISSGHLNTLRVSCFANRYSSENIFPNDAVPLTGTGALNCDNLIKIENDPTTYADWSQTTSFSIDKISYPPNGTLSTYQYCFKVYPVITDDPLGERQGSSIIKCAQPEIKTPSAQEFKGRSSSNCDTSETSINVYWDLPTAGMYSNYRVFWKHDNGAAPFKFSDAITCTPPTTDSTYYCADVPGEDLSYTINNLDSGKNYHFGVLTWADLGTGQAWSEFNTATTTCQTKIPVATFKGWIDITALGPKVDGMTPRQDTANGSPGLLSTILETFEGQNPFDLPVEITVDANNNYTPTGEFVFGGDYGERRFNEDVNNFQGVYGKKAGTLFKHQYSNSGIIRIAWEDVELSDGTKLNDFITSLEAGVAKKDRSFGYKVMRSKDNKNSWEELTKDTFETQSLNNSGLVIPKSFGMRIRSNEPLVSKNIVTFIDYSVKAFDLTTQFTDRARTYYYKIIPVYNNIELTFENENHHIIRVILPPPNMALIHRSMANRTICTELGRSMDLNYHYSCEYNGLGFSSRTIPWTTESAFYDLGHDLLVDRYELGCPFTRGDIESVDSEPITGGGLPNYDFNGLAASGQNFRGCVASKATDLMPGSKAKAPALEYTGFEQVISGDCLGTHITPVYPQVCTGFTIWTKSYSFPGAGIEDTTDCADPDNVYANYFNLDDPDSGYNRDVVNGEFLAVFHHRNNSSGWWSHATPDIKGGANKTLGTTDAYSRPNSCQINIPYQDNTLQGAGRLRPRWFPVSHLKYLMYDSGPEFSVVHKTIGEILSDSRFYDQAPGQKHNAPDVGITSSYNGRYNNNVKIGRIATSNDSRLPPLRGVSQELLDEYCDSYQVSVGHSLDDVNFVQTKAASKKRLLRKKEFTVASAWNPTLDELTLTRLENGNMNNNLKTCNSYDRGLTGLDTVLDNPGDFIGTDKTYDRERAGGRPFLGTGSDRTSKCISRFGIQDLTGNVKETLSDQIYCNFSGHSLNIYDSVTGITLPLSTALGAAGASYYDGYYGRFEIIMISDPNTTGACSVIQADSARTVFVNNGGTLVPSFYLGDLNPDIASMTNPFDKFFIDTLRAADGYFLDFGQGMTFGPPMNYFDTYAIKYNLSVGERINDSPISSGDPRQAKYFNIPLGLPLSCGNGVGCIDSSDNMMASTKELRYRSCQSGNYDTYNGTNCTAVSDSADFEIPNYPVHDSQVLVTGVSEYDDNIEYQYNAGSYSHKVRVLTAITGADPVTVEWEEQDTASTTDLAARHVFWRAERNTPFIMRVGGSNSDREGGRFSAIINSYNRWEQMYDYYSGGRCAIPISSE